MFADTRVTHICRRAAKQWTCDPGTPRLLPEEVGAGATHGASADPEPRQIPNWGDRFRVKLVW